jgi:hypothetical protein
LNHSAVTGWTVFRFHGARGGGPKGERTRCRSIFFRDWPQLQRVRLDDFTADGAVIRIPF